MGKKKCDQTMEVYSRVVGYMRPVSNWNKGKREEFRLRKTICLDEVTEEVFREKIEKLRAMVNEILDSQLSKLTTEEEEQ